LETEAMEGRFLFLAVDAHTSAQGLLKKSSQLDLRQGFLFYRVGARQHPREQEK
jgi:hypothetical protein